MRAILTVVALISASVLCGCSNLYKVSGTRELVVDTVLARRTIVSDDWVYVRSTKKLFRRYIPTKGIMAINIQKGNVALLREAGGRIVRSNKNVVVYGNFEIAAANVPVGTTISPESLPWVSKHRNMITKKLFR